MVRKVSLTINSTVDPWKNSVVRDTDPLAVENPPITHSPSSVSTVPHQWIQPTAIE